MLSIKTSPHLNKLYEATDAMNNWIKENKPDPSRSIAVYQEFMDKWESNITGSEAFITTTKKVIEEASRLATGITIMCRLLKNGNPNMRIIEGESRFHDQEDDSTPESCFIALDFCNPEHFHICLNDKRERALYLSSRITTFIHESLHAWHHFVDIKPKGEPLLPDMDYPCEELVITGNLHQENAEHKDFCCDNTTLLELKMPFRINHRGLSQDHLTLHSFVLNRIYEKIKEQIASGSDLQKKEDELTPLEIAIHSYCKETDIQAQEEWLQVITTLVEAGGLTEHAFRLAVLQNSKELIQLMLKSGAQVTEKLLNEANMELDERVTLIWEKLEEHNTVISNKKIEELCQKTWIGKPGEENYIFLQMDKRNKQYEAVKNKVVDDGSLPIHTIHRLFITSQNKPFQNGEIFLNWIESHSIRKKRTPQPPQPPVKPDVQKPLTNQNDSADVVMHAVVQQESDNGAFEITSEGTCQLSTQHHGCFPQCYKSHSYQIGKDNLPNSYFTQQERENFLHALRAQDFNRLAGSMADRIMESLHLGYTIKSQIGCMMEIDHDAGLWQILEDEVEKTIQAAFTNPSSLSIDIGWLRHSNFFDINLLSKDGSGLLQKNSGYDNGKYKDAIANLKDKNGNPLLSAVCRLSLEDHLNSTTFALYFRSMIIINGETVSELAYG